MEVVSKKIRYSKLLNIYGNLLSNAQKEILKDYYFYDLSITEIAENRNSSRAAVEDAIKKGNAKLDSYEKELRVLASNDITNSLVSQLKQTAKPEQMNIINEIERMLK